MEILATEKIHNEAPLLDSASPLALETKNPAPPRQKEGLALHEIFNEDSLLQIAPPSTFLGSIWKKFFSWPGSEEKSASLSTQTPGTLSTLESVSFEPVLTPPSDMPADLHSLRLPPLSQRGGQKDVLTPIEISEALSLLSDKSIESIMSIIFSAQIDLEKESATVSEGTFSKYAEFQQVQQKILLEIKDVLAQDERFAKKLNRAQYVAIVATVITGIAAAAVSFGLFAPAVGAMIVQTLGPRFGPRAGDLFKLFGAVTTKIGAFGPAATAALTGLTTGAKAYFQRRNDEHTAEHTNREHDHQYYGDRVEESRERLMSVAESDQAFKECWVRLLKRVGRMQKIILKRN